MIDGGAEDVESDDDEVMVTTAFEDFGALSHKLEELGLEAKSAELQRIPNNIKNVTEEQFKINMKMLERFEDDDDVQNVYYNMEITTPNYVGGYFWWYGKQDLVPKSKALWSTFASLIK